MTVPDLELLYLVSPGNGYFPELFRILRLELQPSENTVEIWTLPPQNRPLPDLKLEIFIETLLLAAAIGSATLYSHKKKKWV